MKRVIRMCMFVGVILGLLCIAGETTCEAGDPTLSTSTGELTIPSLSVDGVAEYSVVLRWNESTGMFEITAAGTLPPFEERFRTVQAGMSRQEVRALLGDPDNIQNIIRRPELFGAQPDTLLMRIGFGKEGSIGTGYSSPAPVLGTRRSGLL